MIAIRTEREIALLRQANEIVARVHATLREMIRPGVTTRELDRVADDLIQQLGGIPAFKGYRGYPAATCISVEEVVVHGIPGPRALRDGQIVSIDIGVNYKGYFGDAAVTWPVGKVTQDRQQLLQTTNLALSRAIRAAKAGNYLQDIGKAVERTCKPLGFGVVRDFVGHGIGTAMHESPQIANFDTGRRGPKLKQGMVLAIEPMINMRSFEVELLEDGWTAVTADRLPSAHFEHSVVVREQGGEILSGAFGCDWGHLPD